MPFAFRPERSECTCDTPYLRILRTPDAYAFFSRDLLAHGASPDLDQPRSGSAQPWTVRRRARRSARRHRQTACNVPIRDLRPGAERLRADAVLFRVISLTGTLDRPDLGGSATICSSVNRVVLHGSLVSAAGRHSHQASAGSGTSPGSVIRPLSPCQRSTCARRPFFFASASGTQTADRHSRRTSAHHVLLFGGNAGVTDLHGSLVISEGAIGLRQSAWSENRLGR